MSNNIRLNTNPGSSKNINVSINQDFDFIEILSLKISQDEVYKRFSSNYGVIVGRIIVNKGVGVPNAKVSVFIPIDDEDKLDPEIFGLYPYEVVTDKDSEGRPYSLLPSKTNGKGECHVKVGTFDTKRQIQDNPESEEIYCSYYKFTTTTNNSGDYMIFGVPIGAHNIHVDIDVSDIGVLSQKPYNMINEGSNQNLFKSPNQFKGSNETISPIQNKKITPVSVNVIPFWGDKEQFDIGITRQDIDLLMNITPSALFMGSAITDNEKNSINKKCRPRKKLGKNSELITGPGTIEMIRKSPLGSVEYLDIDGGQLIDENGVWCYQVPMNLDYKITSEKGDLIESPDGKSGIPTRADVRFRIGMDVNGTEGKLRRRAKYLVPNNPDTYPDADYTFDTTTKASSFKTLYWNKIYTVKNHISRVQPNAAVENRNFIGIKNTDDTESNSPFPFNKIDTKGNPIFSILISILSTLSFIMWFLNRSVIYGLNVFLLLFVKLFWELSKLVCTLQFLIGTNLKKKRAQCRCCKLRNLTGNGQGDSECCASVDDCDDGMCTEFIPQALLPYLKIKCGDTKYMLWNVSASENAKAATCDNKDGDGGGPLGDLGGQYLDCVNNDCGSISVGRYLECNATSLADDLNIFKFDFYNDWVNGTTYLFLLKYKFKTNGKEKFCDVDCDWDSLGDYNNDGDADNNCKKNYIVDSCTDTEPQFQDEGSGNLNKSNSKRTVKIEEGYIKKGNDGELYYSAISRFTGYKLFATDIVNLGSINEIDWQGSPQIYKMLQDTTFNVPPNLDEFEEGTNLVETAGLTGRDNLIFKWSYAFPIQITASSDGRNCNNIKRLCELGVGLDEDRQDPLDDLGAADGKIANNDVENPFIRGLFTYVNTISPINANISLIYIDSDNTSTSAGFSDYEDTYYKSFRGVKKEHIWQYENSYYFYFGLNPGKSALTKLVRDFLTPCSSEVDNTFQCITLQLQPDDSNNNPSGLIEAGVIGGVPPLQYDWTGPEININGNIVNYPLPSNQVDSSDSSTISLLYAGDYDLTITDDNANTTSCSFKLSGPPGVLCNVSSTDATQLNASDGTISVAIDGTISPFTYKLYDSSQNEIDSIITNNTSIPDWTGLAAGEYTIIVSDSGDVISSCSETVTISEPDAPSIIITKTDSTCLNGNNGTVTAIVIDTNGGTPNSISWEKNGSPYTSINASTGTNQGDNNITNAGPGLYTLIYEDSLGQEVEASITVTEPTSQGSFPISANNPTSYDLTDNLFPNTSSYITDSSGNQLTQPYTYNHPFVILLDHIATDDLDDEYGVPGGGDTPGYRFFFNINGGTPPYNVTLYDVTVPSNQSQVESWTNITSQTDTMSERFYRYNYREFLPGTNRLLKYEAEDANGCSFESSTFTLPSLGTPGSTSDSSCRWHSQPAYFTPSTVPNTTIPWISLNC